MLFLVTLYKCCYLLTYRLWNSLPIATRDRYLTCIVQETFEDTLVCVGLRRIVTVAFLRRVQIFLLTYLLTYKMNVSELAVVQSVCVRSADGWCATCTSQLQLVNYRPWSRWACLSFILLLSRSAQLLKLLSCFLCCVAPASAAADDNIQLLWTNCRGAVV